MIKFQVLADDEERTILADFTEEGQQVVFLKRSMRPGFAGIENELFYLETALRPGDRVVQAPVQRAEVLGADRHDPRRRL